MSKAVVITFDRWHCGFLGCQGNPWVDTPHFDQLALRATVFDRHFVENLSPAPAQHAWWTGRFQFPLAIEQQRDEPTWLPWLARQGIQTTLLSDPAAQLPLHHQQFAVSRAVPLEDVPGLHFERDVPRFARAAIARIKQMAQNPETSELLWIHSGGLPIDQSSLAYDELYGDDSSELPAGKSTGAAVADSSQEVESADFPPRFWRRQRSSPRELADANLRGTGWSMKGGVATQIDWRRRRDLYSGQVTQWDAWIGRILEAVTALRQAAPVFLAFTAAAGEHLGEHADIEPSTGLFEEQIHVPLIIEVPLDEAFSGRRLALSQAVDLPVTLLDWFQVAVPAGATLDGQSLLPVMRDDQRVARDTVYVGDSMYAGVRTDDYYYRQQLQLIGLEPQEMIFVKPDDRWDADSSLRQYIDAADGLSLKWREFVKSIQSRRQPQTS